MKTLKRYGKSSDFYMRAKGDYLNENEDLLNRSLLINKLYTSQPLRKTCKICNSKMGAAIDFVSHNVPYKICDDCGHLNGIHEDTEDFCQSIYTDNEGAFYASEYIDSNYHKRCKDIYLPKVDFLLETLPGKTLKLIDVGCGAGYLVYAARERGIDAYGIDIGASNVNYGNNKIAEQFKVEPLKLVDEASFTDQLNADYNVVSAIGVIEHLREPYRFFKSFKESEAEYLYFCVPMFSFSTMFENVFDQVFPRQLSCDHTHLFTLSSVDRMLELIGCESIAEWHFGTDVQDLFRSISVKIRSKNSKKLDDVWHEKFLPIVDDLQLAIDKTEFCSEIHMIAKKK